MAYSPERFDPRQCRVGTVAIRLWDVAHRRASAITLDENTGIGIVRCDLFSPNGVTLASGRSGQYAIRLWDAATGARKCALIDEDTGVVQHH